MQSINMRRYWHIHALLLLALGKAGVGQATEMQFRGKLIEPPVCSINDDGIVDVNFGDRLGVNKVDGVNYRQAVNYRISCEGSTGTDGMTLIFSGAVSTFDKAALQTSMSDLGIRIYQNDQPMAPGSKIAINPSSPPQLEAVPVQRPGAVLSEGQFEATATLQVNYQ
ncbi:MULTISPECIES: fimbrial protein [Serratia]|uniref:fimbrial protein n=1 Tax=Serratia TaxID=613 RepID=UPI002182C5FD|nr:fimbrial protein [Serratia liquefaciens]CAI2486732.1 putative minor fimbrial subunit StfF [Serratia liquefaciens]